MRPDPLSERRHPPLASDGFLSGGHAHLVGWSDGQLAIELGLRRAVVFRMLEAEVAAGRVVRLECGGRRLYARLGHGRIQDITPERAADLAREPAPKPRPGRQPADHRPKGT